MLKRFYVDNFRALVNSEIHFGARTLLMGANGTGKTTIGDALLAIQVLLIAQSKTDDIFQSPTLTRWQSSPKQRFELDVTSEAGLFQYKLTVEHRETFGTDQPRTRVTEETLTLNGNPLFRFEDGLVRLFRDDHSPGPEYPFDWGRSALATISSRHDNKSLTAFGNWVRQLTILKPNPQRMEDLVEKDDFILFQDASNFSAWYHVASAADKRRDQQLHKTLAEVLPGFEALNFDPAGPGRWLLRAEFSDNGRQLPLRFGELSDGQRTLILLYAIQHFLLGNHRTVFLDEPDNFVALGEIQPWLLSTTDLVDSGKGQVVVVSHHPEIFDQWAVSSGLVSVRDGCGPVRFRAYEQPTDTELTPAETIARGWVTNP